MDHSDQQSAPPSGTAVGPFEEPVRTRWWVELAWYALSFVLTILVLVLGLRIDKADFTAPFTYEYDALLILPLVQTTVENGTHWRNERLGAPGIQELHDFPVIDHLHFAIIRALGLLLDNPVVVFNVFHLLTYPLTAVIAMFVLRRFGLSVPAALAGGMLFAFQPYHYLRGQVHYFLSAYYMIPLTVMVMLWLCQGRLPFFRREADGHYRLRLFTWDSLAVVVIAILTASAGAYYAFFGCAMLVVAGFYGWFVTRTWKACVAAWFVILIIVLAGVANHIPTILYQAEFGQNTRPHVRMAEDSERYGMKIAQVVFPVAGHNPVGAGSLTLFDPAAIRSRYQAPQFRELNETDWDPIGFIAVLGYLSLLAATIVPYKRGWPIGPLAALAVFATLLGTTGGFGAIFNYLVTSQVRCYNRISIYIAFLALFAAVWAVDRFFRTRTGRARHWCWPAFILLIAFGLWDQTNDQWFPDLRIKKQGYVGADDQRAETARRWQADREFFERVESLLPEGAMVFTYPYVEYPESQPYQEPGRHEKIESYDQVIGFLHTRKLRFSFGAIKGREVDTWFQEVCREIGSTTSPNAERFLERLARAGFEGLLVDSRGLNPGRWNRLKRALEGPLGHGALREVHADRRLYFYDLRGYRDTLRRNEGPAFEAMARAEWEAPVALWLKGFASYEPTGYENRLRWCGPDGLLMLVNRSERTIVVRMEMKFSTTFKDTADLRLRSPIPMVDGTRLDVVLEIGPETRPQTRSWDLVLTPGRHSIRFHCSPHGTVLPSDSRNELFSVHDFKLTELPPQSAR